MKEEERKAMDERGQAEITDLEVKIKEAADQIKALRIRALIPEIEEAIKETMEEFGLRVEDDDFGYMEIVDWSADHICAMGFCRAIDLVGGIDYAELSCHIDMAIAEIHCPEFTIPDVDIQVSFKL